MGEDLSEDDLDMIMLFVDGDGDGKLSKKGKQEKFLN